MNYSGLSLTRTAGRIFVAILLGLIVLNFTALIILKSDLLPQLMTAHVWSNGFLSHTAMWVISLILMLVISKGSLRAGGFCLGKNYNFPAMITAGIATGVVFTLVLKTLSNSETVFMPDYNFGQTVIFIWFYASFSEEILTRGLIQSFLAPLAPYGLSISSVRISIPVIVSALFFGLMHLGLLTTGMELLPVLIIVLFAAVLGVFAGYYREKTGSLLPAIIIHTFGNIGGYCATLLVG